jgi:hypothetical protein
VIRRVFWLIIGAAGGIMGYRRVAALGRRLSGRRGAAQGTLAGQSPASTRTAGTGSVGRLTAGGSAWLPRVLRATRAVRGFSRDVREGMELYSARRPRGAGPTLPPSNDNTRT